MQTLLGQTFQDPSNPSAKYRVVAIEPMSVLVSVVGSEKTNGDPWGVPTRKWMAARLFGGPHGLVRVDDDPPLSVYLVDYTSEKEWWIAPSEASIRAELFAMKCDYEGVPITLLRPSDVVRYRDDETRERVAVSAELIVSHHLMATNDRRPVVFVSTCF